MMQGKDRYINGAMAH